MKKFILMFVAMFMMTMTTFAQQTTVEGSKFFDKYSNEIFELYYDFKEETGYTLSVVDKNSLTSFSYELIASNLYDEVVVWSI